VELVVVGPDLGWVGGDFLAIQQESLRKAVESSVIGGPLDDQGPLRSQFFSNLEIADPVVVGLGEIKVVGAQQATRGPALVFLQGSFRRRLFGRWNAGQSALFRTIPVLPNH